MMQQNNSLQNIDPSALAHFIRHLCMAGKKHYKKELHSLNKPEHLEGGTKTLYQRIAQLENELLQAKRERDVAVVENKQKIESIRGSIERIKADMHKFIEGKKQRGKKLKKK